jgi:O-methyltransferase
MALCSLLETANFCRQNHMLITHPKLASATAGDRLALPNVKRLPGRLTKSWSTRSHSRLFAKFKTQILRMSYWLAYRLAPSVAYTRQPFVRYPYMYSPSEMLELANQLLSVEVSGVAVEVGCNQGWTSMFLLEAMAERGFKRNYVCIDTFEGFTPDDVGFEYAERGKPHGMYDEYFAVNHPEWLRGSLSRSGYENVSVQKADATTFNYGSLGRIAFALIDVDLYRPVRKSLERIMPYMAPGGIVLVDDCDITDERWDGAHQAYLDFCDQQRIQPEIVGKKLGLIRV